jgi:hypothetical protein
MPLGNATLKSTDVRPEGVLLHVAEVEGVPDNGLNIIGIPFVDAGIDPVTFDASYLQPIVRPLTQGSSVEFVSEGVHPDPVEPGSALSADKKSIALDFVQTGADQVVVQIVLLNTVVQ